MNWLAYNYATMSHCPTRPGQGRLPDVSQCETAEGRLDSLDPDNFRYQLTAREIKAA